MKQKLNIYFLAVLLAGVFWGTAGIYVRTLEGFGIDQMQLVLFRALFSTIIFAKECLKRFGEPGDKIVLTYREKDEKETEQSENDTTIEEVIE